MSLVCSFRGIAHYQFQWEKLFFLNEKFKRGLRACAIKSQLLILRGQSGFRLNYSVMLKASIYYAHSIGLVKASSILQSFDMSHHGTHCLASLSLSLLFAAAKNQSWKHTITRTILSSSPFCFASWLASFLSKLHCTRPWTGQRIYTE